MIQSIERHLGLSSLASMKIALLLIFAYLLGSIPTSYIVARWIQGIDLRRYGSGTVSGSMLYEHTQRWLIVPAGLFDIFKAFLPTWLALRLGYGDLAAVAAGAAAIIGHNWPIYLGFTGGRGLSTFLGAMLAIYPWGDLWLLLFWGAGFALGDSAPFALASFLLFPLLVYFTGAPTALYWLCAAMLIITLAKRVEANHRPLPEEQPERRRVILRRLFFDRDIQNHKAWIHRHA